MTLLCIAFSGNNARWWNRHVFDIWQLRTDFYNRT